ncbi:MAG: hypothetical protein J5926_04340 [Ruminococcus sp.]|nr:hypothetical protein [Ruminococcus sp.]
MNNLIKAEWFRLRHSGSSVLSGNLFIIIFMNLIITLFQFIGSEGLDISAMAFVTHAGMGIAMSVMVPAAMITGTFDSRLANYEIMKGTPPLQTVLSKMLLVLILNTVFYFIPSIILVQIFDSGVLTAKMILLMYVCIAKSIVFATSICILFKSGAGTVIFVFAFAFQTMPLVILQYFTGIDMSAAASWFTTTQVMIIGNQLLFDLEDMTLPLDGSYIEIKVILSFMITVAVMIPLAHKSLKDKWEIQLTSPA